MIELRDEATGEVAGTVTEKQFGFLFGELVEEDDEDRDYYINQATVDMLEQDGADPDLVAILRRALGGRKDMDIVWSRV